MREIGESGPRVAGHGRLDARCWPEGGAAGSFRSGDDGFATVWVAWAITALLALVMVIIGLGTAVITRHRVESAADLAALSAAARVVVGDESACERARWVAERMRVSIVECRVDGMEVTVRVSARPPGVLAGVGAAHASARAGPVDGG